MLNTVAKILADEGLAVMGSDTFIHFMPYGMLGTLILPKMSGDTIDQDTPKFRHGGFQIVVRASDYDDTLILAITQALTVPKLVTEDYDIKYIRPKNEPVCYTLQDNTAIEYSVNFETLYARVFS